MSRGLKSYSGVNDQRQQLFDGLIFFPERGDTVWSLQWVLWWWKYQTLRCKIRGTYRCVTSNWKEDLIYQVTVLFVIIYSLLQCNFLPSFDNFSILAHENKKYLLEIKKSLLIMRNKPSLNGNINFAPFYLFDKVFQQVIIFTLDNLT